MQSIYSSPSCSFVNIYPLPLSAAAIGSTDEGDLFCQSNDTSTATAEHIPIILNYQKRSRMLEGSAQLSNCSSVLYCVDGSNIPLPRQLELVDTHDGYATATVTIRLLQLTEAISELSLGRFCCADRVSQPDSTKCFVPELKCEVSSWVITSLTSLVL